MDLMVPSEEEVLSTAAVFQGDILPSFTSHWNGKFKHIFAIEPESSEPGSLGNDGRKPGLEGTD